MLYVACHREFSWWRRNLISSRGINKIWGLSSQPPDLVFFIFQIGKKISLSVIFWGKSSGIKLIEMCSGHVVAQDPGAQWPRPEGILHFCNNHLLITYCIPGTGDRKEAETASGPAVLQFIRGWGMFTQPFIECLLYTRHCSRCWGDTVANKAKIPGTHNLVVVSAMEGRYWCPRAWLWPRIRGGFSKVVTLALRLAR